MNDLQNTHDKEFDEKFPWHQDDTSQGMSNKIKLFRRQCEVKAYELGKKEGRGNVSALRQFINERPANSSLITNEDINTFLDL